MEFDKFILLLWGIAGRFGPNEQGRRSPWCGVGRLVVHGRRGLVVALQVLQAERVGHVHGGQLAGRGARQQLGREPARQLVVAAARAARAAQLCNTTTRYTSHHTSHSSPPSNSTLLMIVFVSPLVYPRGPPTITRTQKLVQTYL